MGQAQSSQDNYLIDQEEIVFTIKDFIVEFFFIELEEITRETRFDEDICADDITFADCVDALEEEFAERTIGFKIDVNERAELETVGNLIDAVCAHVEVKGG